MGEMTNTRARKQALIPGGGFGGLYTALELKKTLARDRDIQVDCNSLIRHRARPVMHKYRSIFRAHPNCQRVPETVRRTSITCEDQIPNLAVCAQWAERLAIQSHFQAGRVANP